MDGGLAESADPRLEDAEDVVATGNVSSAGAAPVVEMDVAADGPDAGCAETVQTDLTDDDDVVLVEAPPLKGPSPAPSPPDGSPVGAPVSKPADCVEESSAAVVPGNADASEAPTPPPAPPTKSLSETIVIDDEEDSFEQKDSSSNSAPDAQPPGGALSSTEPDSEIKIASVTTLGSASTLGVTTLGSASTLDGDSSEAAVTAVGSSQQGDMKLMITSVTSLQDSSLATEEVLEVDNGLQISNTFSLNPEAQRKGSQTNPCTSGRPAAQSGSSSTFNPGRIGTAREPVQNGETGTHQRPDSWISQSASFPRNQKQPSADSPSPAASSPKPPLRSSSSSSSGGSQQPPRTVKVTCANCKKPLKKGQTAYQRKGSAHLFCSTTCLSAFSHKPAPKKNCTMCKKDITSMKGTIVAQVDSSESFQEFCSTGCLTSYETKQNPPKTPVKTKCTVCGKLTEIRHEVSFKNVTHKICSDACFNRYRMANGLIMNCCEQCGDYLPSKASANHFLLIDGQQKRFCSQNCVKDYKQAHGKMTNCSGCKTACRSFDVTQCIGPSGIMEPYCSTACMTSHKSKATGPAAVGEEPTCHFCHINALPQYQATLPDGKVYNFCSSNCVTKFQNANVHVSTNGQPVRSSASNNIQLKCNYCRGAFSLKPETLEWENKVYQFCSKTCCEDYKKLHCIVTFCEYCQEEKTLHETVKFSGVKRPFCSEGCKLLFKQDFVRRLGLKCVTCNYCSQMCKRGVTKLMDGVQREFCSEACSKKFHDWYYKAARCDCCKVQGNLTETVHWRAELKHFCDQQCLLRFYCQQNEPNMATQKGPENMNFGYGGTSQGSKTSVYNQASLSPYAGGGMLKDAKNKAVLCKPLTMTKATYCKPHMQSKHCQTEEVSPEHAVKKEYVPVPIPVPVYIPVPMNLYAQATPAPVTLPVPVPVPVFLPTTLDSAEQIVQTILELKTKVPSEPLEADLLTVAGMIAEADEEKPTCPTNDVMSERVMSEDVKRERVTSESSSCSSSPSEEETTPSDDSYEPDLDLESDLPQVPDPVPAIEDLDTEIGFPLPPILGDEKEEIPRPKIERKGRKRRAVAGDSLPSSPDSPGAEDAFALKSRYGVNAWKRWVLTSAKDAQDDKGQEKPKQVGPAWLKRNLLSLSVVELNRGLSRFVGEVRRPKGDAYAPDSIFYLCLGIQRHLQDNGRSDDIFADPQYQLFGQELNKVLKGWQPSVLPDGSMWGRVEERSLWGSKQLGDHTPAALLRSLVYLNTKYFGLRTVEQHLRLSFGNVYGHPRINPNTQETSVCIRIPSVSEDRQDKCGSRKRKRKEEDGESDSELNDDFFCPVKKHECRLYELYLSKCPVTLRQRMDMFYMKPEASDDSASPLWYTSTPLDRADLESILTRALLTKNIYSKRDRSEEEEEEEEAEDGGE